MSKLGLKPIELEDIVRIARISGVDVSSRGEAAFVVTRPDLDRNENRTTITVVSADGEVYLEGRDYSMPRWSPDGSLLAFQARKEEPGKEAKGSGVYLWGRSGEPRLLSWFKHGIMDMRWASSDEIAVLAPVPVPGFHDEDGDYVIADDLPLWLDGSGFVSSTRPQIYLVDRHSGTARVVTGEPTGVRGLAPCNGILYYYTPVSWDKPYLHVLKAYRGGSVEEVARGYSISMARCVDGTLHLLAHRLERGVFSHHKLYRLIDGGLRCETCGILDREIFYIGGSYGDGVSIAYMDSGKTPIAVFSDSLEVVLDKEMMVYELESNRGSMYIVASSPTRPPEVYKFSNGGLERVSRVNEWFTRKYDLVEPARVSVSAGKDKVDGWILLPPSKGRKPLILYIHGGPKAMYGYAFYPEMQLMASRGFVVAYANPRGSDGYSEEFADIRGRYGEDDYEQLMAFLDHVISGLKDEVDEQRMAVTGISYGGYMTNVVVTKTSRFKAAISENGIADWIADYWASDIGYWFDEDQIGGSPLNNLAGYVDKSPVYRASRVSTPLLLIHSMEDYRCFIDQALAMHVALKTLGKESRLVVFTKGSHGHSVRAQPRHRLKRLKLIIGWLEDKLGLTGNNARGEERVH